MRRVLLISLLALLPGCDRAATTTVPDGVVELTARDYRYDHQHVRVPPGPVTFLFVNAGRTDTNFRLRRRGQGRDRALARILTLEPGERGTTTVTLRPGRYVMYSSVGRNETLGEHGTLTVTSR